MTAMRLIENVTIRPIAESDLQKLNAHFPSSRPSRHRLYWLLQQRGWLTYLAAWFEERPIGHGTIRWLGPRESTVAALYPNCPEILGFGIVEEFRSHGLGTQMIYRLEAEARQRKTSTIGLAVGVENRRAQSLYRRLGYSPANVGTYLDRWYWLDQNQSKMWVADECLFMLKKL